MDIEQSGTVLACMNTKGGVGKTTTTVFLAHAFASHGANVLVVDLDHQSNATDLLEPEIASPDEARSVYDLTASQIQGAYKYASYPSVWNKLEPIASSTLGKIDLVPGDPQYLDNHVTENGINGLEVALRGSHNDYDLVLLDCPPSTGPVVQSALLAATSVLLITESKHLALRSFGRTIVFLNEVSDAVGRDIDPVGILVTKYNNRKTEDRMKLAVLKSRYPELLIPVRIPERTAVDAAHTRHIPVDSLQTPHARLVANAYITAAMHTAERIGLSNESVVSALAKSVADMSNEGEQVA